MMINQAVQPSPTPQGAEKRQHHRRDAACPATARLWVASPLRDFVVRGRLVNISESGCMIGAKQFPWTDDALGEASGETGKFPEITEHILVHLPWTDTTLKGEIRRRGPFSLHIQLVTQIPSRLVDRIARMDSPPGDVAGPRVGALRGP